MFPLPKTRPALLVAALATAVAACSPALNWREVRPESTALLAMFPCKPGQQERSLPLAGAMVQMRLYACEAEGASWALSHADVGDPARVGPALQELRAALLQHLGRRGASAPPSPFSVPGMTPQAEAQRFTLRGERGGDGKAMELQVGLFSQGSVV
ncbi:MAG TPA: hypothetical protein VFV25_09055, partial [Methylibium sp.]